MIFYKCINLPYKRKEKISNFFLQKDEYKNNSNKTKFYKKIEPVSSLKFVYSILIDKMIQMPSWGIFI